VHDRQLAALSVCFLAEVGVSKLRASLTVVEGEQQMALAKLAGVWACDRR
jgi:hypothetical protein